MISHLNDLCVRAEKDLSQHLTLHFFEDVDTIQEYIPHVTKIEYLLVYKQHQQLFDKYIQPPTAMGCEEVDYGS